MPTFAEQIAKHVAKYQRQLAHVTQGTVIMVGKALVERSPVGKWSKWSEMGQGLNPMPPYVAGEFVGSWAYSNGTVGKDYPATIDASGYKSMERFMEVKAAPTAARHFLHNNSPYAWVMETGVHPLIKNWRLVSGNHPVQLALMDSKMFVRTAVAQARNIS